jgi:hypothetical protein
VRLIDTTGEHTPMIESAKQRKQPPFPITTVIEIGGGLRSETSPSDHFQYE